MREPEGLLLDDVTAAYGERVALRDVAIRVSPGEIVGLIGPNGSGKTTAVRVASRALRPVRGHVSVAGRDPYAMRAREAARLVAVVPQELTTTFEFTALEVVLMGRAPYVSPFGALGGEEYGRARAAMEAAGVQHLADRPVTELSGGEKQRVVLAQALAQDAPVLLLDEPTTHLDPTHVVSILAAIRDLADAGRSVLAVFHDLNLASGICDRLVALDGGRVAAEGRAEEVLTPAALRDIYGVEPDVHPHPATGRPTVVLAPARPASAGHGRRRAHVVGGAGRGASLMRGLAEAGFEVTAGVLHASDTDALVAERLNLLRIAVPPFSEVDDAAQAEVLDLMRRAEVIVVADAPYGPGNVGNLRAVARACQEGARILLLDDVPIRERDFTGGEATRLWVGIEGRAVRAGSYREVLAAVGSSR